MLTVRSWEYNVFAQLSSYTENPPYEKKKKNTESAIRKQQIEEVSNLNRTSILQTCKSKQQELIKELIQ